MLELVFELLHDFALTLFQMEKDAMLYYNTDFDLLL